MSGRLPLIVSLLATASAASTPADAQPGTASSRTGTECGKESTGIVLSPGFCATVFADKIGHARHMVVRALMRLGRGRFTHAATSFT